MAASRLVPASHRVVSSASLAPSNTGEGWEYPKEKCLVVAVRNLATIWYLTRRKYLFLVAYLVFLGFFVCVDL